MKKSIYLPFIVSLCLSASSFIQSATWSAFARLMGKQIKPVWQITKGNFKTKRNRFILTNNPIRNIKCFKNFNQTDFYLLLEELPPNQQDLILGKLARQTFFSNISIGGGITIVGMYAVYITKYHCAYTS